MSHDLIVDLRASIRNIPDFPEPGIQFKDITPVLSNPELLDRVVDAMVERAGVSTVEKVVGIDARGFIFGALVAARLGVGFVPARKKGKLPYATRGVAYDLEYGTSSLEMHVDAVEPGERVLLADDLLATGGTAGAALQLIAQAEAEIIGSVFLIELEFLSGRSRLEPFGPVHSLVTY